MAEQIENKRVKFPKGNQKLFIEAVNKRYNLNGASLARILGIEIRTLSDWRTQKSTMNYGSVLNLCKVYGISLPKEVTVLPEFWYIDKASRLGARARNRIYGNPGTMLGRRKGGLATIKKMMSDTRLAKKLGFLTKKDIRYPKNDSHLAEFIGIVLGDGSLTDYWLKVTFNRITDNRITDNMYSIFIQRLIKRLFGLSSKIILHKSDNSSDIVVYSKMLTDYMVRIGLKKGNKVRNKADIPCWIKQDRALRLSCIRGLSDTDGSFYAYKHTVKGNIYTNFAFCFTNRSPRLLKSVYDILRKEQFNVIKTKDRVYLYRMDDIKKYFNIIGTHNRKHLEKYKNFVNGVYRLL